MKFVSELTQEEIFTLEEVFKFSSCYRQRQRAHMVLLSHKNYQIDEIADIFQMHRDRVSVTIDRWESCGIVGLKDKVGSGRKNKFNDEQRAQIISWVDENTPRGTNEILHYIEKSIGIHVCEDTVKNLLKAEGYSWKRLRKAIKHKRDEDLFSIAQNEIKELKKRHDYGDIDLQYFDGSGFSLTPTVPYAWQKKG